MTRCCAGGGCTEYGLVMPGQAFVFMVAKPWPRKLPARIRGPGLAGSGPGRGAAENRVGQGDKNKD